MSEKAGHAASLHEKPSHPRERGRELLSVTEGSPCAHATHTAPPAWRGWQAAVAAAGGHARPARGGGMPRFEKRRVTPRRCASPAAHTPTQAHTLCTLSSPAAQPRTRRPPGQRGRPASSWGGSRGIFHDSRRATTGTRACVRVCVCRVVLRARPARAREAERSARCEQMEGKKKNAHSDGRKKQTPPCASRLLAAHTPHARPASRCVCVRVLV